MLSALSLRDTSKASRASKGSRCPKKKEPPGSEGSKKDGSHCETRQPVKAAHARPDPVSSKDPPRCEAQIPAPRSSFSWSSDGNSNARSGARSKGAGGVTSTPDTHTRALSSASSIVSRSSDSTIGSFGLASPRSEVDPEELAPASAEGSSPVPEGDIQPGVEAQGMAGQILVSEADALVKEDAHKQNTKHNAELAWADAEMERVLAELAARERQLAEKEQQLEARALDLTHKQEQLRGKEVQLEDKELWLKDREEQVEASERQAGTPLTPSSLWGDWAAGSASSRSLLSCSSSTVMPGILGEKRHVPQEAAEGAGSGVVNGRKSSAQPDGYCGDGGGMVTRATHVSRGVGGPSSTEEAASSLLGGPLQAGDLAGDSAARLCQPLNSAEFPAEGQEPGEEGGGRDEGSKSSSALHQLLNKLSVQDLMDNETARTTESQAGSPGAEEDARGPGRGVPAAASLVARALLGAPADLCPDQPLTPRSAQASLATHLARQVVALKAEKMCLEDRLRNIVASSSLEADMLRRDKEALEGELAAAREAAGAAEGASATRLAEARMRAEQREGELRDQLAALSDRVNDLVADNASLKLEAERRRKEIRGDRGASEQQQQDVLRYSAGEGEGQGAASSSPGLDAVSSAQGGSENGPAVQARISELSQQNEELKAKVGVLQLEKEAHEQQVASLMRENTQLAHKVKRVTLAAASAASASRNRDTAEAAQVEDLKKVLEEERGKHEEEKKEMRKLLSVARAEADARQRELAAALAVAASDLEATKKRVRELECCVPVEKVMATELPKPRSSAKAQKSQWMWGPLSGSASQELDLLHSEIAHLKASKKELEEQLQAVEVEAAVEMNMIVVEKRLLEEQLANLGGSAARPASLEDLVS